MCTKEFHKRTCAMGSHCMKHNDNNHGWGSMKIKIMSVCIATLSTLTKRYIKLCSESMVAFKFIKGISGWSRVQIDELSCITTRLKKIRWSNKNFHNHSKLYRKSMGTVVTYLVFMAHYLNQCAYTPICIYIFWDQMESSSLAGVSEYTCTCQMYMPNVKREIPIKVFSLLSS